MAVGDAPSEGLSRAGGGGGCRAFRGVAGGDRRRSLRRVGGARTSHRARGAAAGGGERRGSGAGPLGSAPAAGRDRPAGHPAARRAGGPRPRTPRARFSCRCSGSRRRRPGASRRPGWRSHHPGRGPARPGPAPRRCSPRWRASRKEAVCPRSPAATLRRCSSWQPRPARRARSRRFRARWSSWPAETLLGRGSFAHVFFAGAVGGGRRCPGGIPTCLRRGYGARRAEAVSSGPRCSPRRGRGARGPGSGWRWRWSPARPEKG